MYLSVCGGREGTATGKLHCVKLTGDNIRLLVNNKTC